MALVILSAVISSLHMFEYRQEMLSLKDFFMTILIFYFFLSKIFWQTFLRITNLIPKIVKMSTDRNINLNLI